MLWGSKLNAIIISILTIFSSIIIIQSTPVQAQANTSNRLTVHNPIIIFDNHQFTYDNGVVGGSGIKEDPYIIENLSINALSSHGIRISNTNVYFVIKNCYIFNGSESYYYGIYFENVKNGRVINNDIVNNENGIYLFNSNNNIIANNNIKYHLVNGLYLERSKANKIVDNQCNYNNLYGLYLTQSSSKQIVENNNFSSNGYEGITILESDNNTISKNICSLNMNDGIHITSNSDYNDINNNTLSSNRGNGLAVFDSTHNQIIDNDCINNLFSGIYLSLNTNAQNLIHNNCSNNNIDGMFIEAYSDNHVIKSNICNNNGGNGLNLNDTSFSLILNNTCNFNFDCGIFSSGGENSIINNKCIENFVDGIHCVDNSNIIKENNCRTNNRNGIYLYCSRNNILENNDCRLNEINGIQLYVSTNNQLSKNYCAKNLQSGIYISSSSLNNTIEKNICVYNSKGITVYRAIYNEIVENTCNNNLKNGIEIDGDSCKLFKNQCNLNRISGIYCHGSLNLIFNNTCENNNNGIESSGITNYIKFNYCNFNQNGIVLKKASYNFLQENKMESCGILILGKSVQHWNTHFIDKENTVNNKPVYYLKNMHQGTIPFDAGEIILANCENIEIADQDLSYSSIGIILGFTSESFINNSRCFANNNCGIYLFESNNNSFRDNDFSNNYYGIKLENSENNRFVESSCNNNKIYGIYLDRSPFNKIVNCTVTKNSYNDFYLLYDSYDNIAINTTFNTIDFEAYSSDLIVKNYLHVQVNDKRGRPVKGADVSVYDNYDVLFPSKYKENQNSKTNIFGRLKWIQITDRIYYGSRTAIENITIVNVKFIDLEKDERQRVVDMSTSHFEKFVLNIDYNVVPTKVKLIKPVNETALKDPTPTFSWNKSYDENGDQISYILQIDEFGGNWQSLVYTIHTGIDVINWTMSYTLVDSKYQWRVCAFDGKGRGPWSDIWNFTIDSNGPNSNIVFPLNNGYYNALPTISGKAKDFNKGTGVQKVEISIRRICDDFYWNGSTWIVNEHWLLTTGQNKWSFNSCNISWDTDLKYHIRSKATDYLNNIEIPNIGVYFVFDNTPPEVSIEINNGDDYTNCIIVDLNITASDTGSDVTMMAFSDFGDEWSSWETYIYKKTHKILRGDGEKYVFVKVKDQANNCAQCYDTIVLDTNPPYALFLMINDGSSITKSMRVTLTLDAKDALSGVDQMAFSADGIHWSSWEQFNTTKPYILPQGEKVKITYFVVKDKAGNVGIPIMEIVIWDNSVVNDNSEDDPPNNILEEQKKIISTTVFEYWIFVLIFTILLIISIIIYGFHRRNKKFNQKNIYQYYRPDPILNIDDLETPALALTINDKSDPNKEGNDPEMVDHDKEQAKEISMAEQNDQEKPSIKAQKSIKINKPKLSPEQPIKPN